MNRTAVFAGAAALFGDVALFNMVFVSFAYLQTGNLMQMGFPFWVSCILLLYLGNVAFLRRPRAVPVLAAVNVFGFGVMTAVNFLFFTQISGVLPYGFAVLFLIITTVRACSLALYPMTVSHMLSCFNALLIGIFFYALVQAAGGVPREYNLVLLAGLLLEIAALAFLRIFADGRNVFCGSRWQGITLLAGSFGAFGLLLFLFFTLLSENARSAASQFAIYVVAAIQAVARGALWLITALLSLIPVGEPQEFVPEPGLRAGGLEAAEAIEEVALDPSILIVLGCIAAVLLLGLFVFLLFRLRRVKLTVRFGGGGAAISTRPDLLGGLKRRLSAKLAVIRFALTSLYYRNTPPGVLISLERWGKLHRVPRLTGETHGAFLLRLGTKTPFSEGEIPALLDRLRRELDVMYYAGAGLRSADALSGQELRRIRAVLRGRPEYGRNRPIYRARGPLSFCDSGYVRQKHRFLPNRYRAND